MISVSPSGPHVPTRTRTRNTSLGSRHDLRFTIGTGSGRQGIRTLTPLRAHSLAPRPGQPYPATFRLAVDPPGVEPGPPPCHSGALPLGNEPVASISGLPGNRTPISCLQGRCLPVGPAARRFAWIIFRLSSVRRHSPRSARDSNPDHLPTTEACRLNTCGPEESSRQDSNLR
jgi:hypothetical protein